MFNFLRWFYDWLLRLLWYVYNYAQPINPRYAATCLQGFGALILCDDRATEMDVTIIGLQNAGKTSLLRVLAVSSYLIRAVNGHEEVELRLISYCLAGRRIYY